MSHPHHRHPGRSGKIPAESIVHRHWSSGMTRADMAVLYGVKITTLATYLIPRIRHWQTEPPKTIEPDARKIILPAHIFTDHAYRKTEISLPRITMHELALADRAARRRILGRGR